MCKRNMFEIAMRILCNYIILLWGFIIQNLFHQLSCIAFKFIYISQLLFIFLLPYKNNNCW